MKKIKIIGIFIIFILSVISHFTYEIIPNKITSIFFPVNESIWEHMKLFITPTLLFSIIEYIIYKNKDILFNNFVLSYSISIIISIIIYLLIYLPIDYLFGHNSIFAIILLFISFILLQFINYYIMNKEEIKYSNIIGLTIIIILYAIFTYLTYNPIKTNLFYDKQKNIYGINKKFR